MPLNRSQEESEIAKNIQAKLSVLGGEQQEHLARQRADQLKLPYVSLVAFPVNSEVLELVPKEEAKAAEAVLFYKQGRDIRVGVVNPASKDFQELLGRLENRFNVRLQVYLISVRSLNSALARYRREQQEEAKPQQEMRVTAGEASGFEETLKDLEQLGGKITSLPPTEMLNAIVAGAVKKRASDIHIEPREKMARLRYRIDGVLQDVTTFGREGWALVLSRIKVLSKLKLNVKDVPQDGSYVLRIDGETYDMRVSVLPGDWGENIVIRLLDRRTEVVGVEELGMKRRDYQVVQEGLKLSNGMILVTGPTGSGKTTTLASFVQEINQPELKIITLEDPIEYRIAGVEQTEVDESAGYTFSRGLRSILRQDPDIVLVGEMRDTETAETAVHASLTGHLVFTTLHTNDAAGAVPRLVDMGIKPFVLGSALHLVIAQRLVRVVCPKCAKEYKPDAKLLEQVRETMEGVRPDVFDLVVLRDKNLRFVKAVGCQECDQTGYRGRRGVFEIFTVTDEIEKLVLQAADRLRIQEAALRQGMTTIAQDAYLKVIDKVTTVEEVERVSNK